MIVSTILRPVANEYELVLDEQRFAVPMIPLIANCHLFQENRILISQPNYRVQYRVSVSSFRLFIAAINGSEILIRDLIFLSTELKFAGLLITLSEWRSVHAPADSTAALSGLADTIGWLRHDIRVVKAESAGWERVLCMVEE
jgi:hypothetical protein